MLSDRCPVCLSCLSVLSVMLVHCDQTVGRIKMKLGLQVCLGPGHIVLDEDPAPPPQRGTAPPQKISAHICCGEVAAWIKMPLGMEVGGRPRPRRLCVRWGPAPPPQNYIFGPCLLWPNGWMDHDGTWHGDRPQHRQRC